MAITIAQVCDAIKSTLEDATEIDVAQSYDELTEGINDPKLLQVYPDSGSQDVATTNDRTTFRAGVRQTELVILADYYARQRAHLGEDMAQLVDGIDSIFDVLEAQTTKPLFGLEGIQSFAWSFRRVTFEYGDPLARYVGARFEIRVRIF